MCGPLHELLRIELGIKLIIHVFYQLFQTGALRRYRWAFTVEDLVFHLNLCQTVHIKLDYKKETFVFESFKIWLVESLDLKQFANLQWLHF